MTEQHIAILKDTRKMIFNYCFNFCKLFKKLTIGTEEKQNVAISLRGDIIKKNLKKTELNMLK